jgi:DHA2 family multidrug resistance protein
MVAYVNDFRIMMAITVMAIPLLLLIRRSRPSAAASGDVPH